MKQKVSVETTVSPLRSAFWLMVPVMLAALFLVWTRVQNLSAGYALARTQAALRKAKEEQRVLEIEVNALSSADRLQSMARHRFRLSAPTKKQVIRP